MSSGDRVGGGSREEKERGMTLGNRGEGVQEGERKGRPVLLIKS